jgi:hypothetical protein
VIRSKRQSPCPRKAPSSKLQAPEKLQIPSSKLQKNPKLQSLKERCSFGSCPAQSCVACQAPAPGTQPTPTLSISTNCTDNITVRKVYAESAVYAIDVQDHNQPGQANRNVVLEDIYAVRCKHALRTANSHKGHVNLTVRDITAEQCAIPVQISHTENVNLGNVRVLDPAGGKPPIQITDCHGVSIRDVLVQNATIKGPALLLQNCDENVVDGFNVRGQTNKLESAICFRLTRQETFSGLRISNVSVRDVTEAGIVLEATGKQKGTLTDYLVTGNLATVQDKIQGRHAVVTNNLP